MNDDEIYECDKCGSEVKESDTSCPKCGGEFEEVNGWYKGIEKEISSLKEKMTKSDSELYELDLLAREAKHVAGFSPDCEYCQGHRNDISNLVTSLSNLPMTNEDVEGYGITFRSILKHLEKSHGLRRGGSKIMKVLLVVAGISFVVLVVNFWIGIGTTSGWEPDVENNFRFIQTFSNGLFIASIVGIIIMAIIRQLKM